MYAFSSVSVVEDSLLTDGIMHQKSAYVLQERHNAQQIFSVLHQD